MEVTFKTSYKNTLELVITPDELKGTYMFGVDVRDQRGESIPDETYLFYILAAQTEIERYLTIKLFCQEFTENRDFKRKNYLKWNYLPTTYPVVEPISLKGFVNKIPQTTYPREWLSVKKYSEDEDLHNRQINIIPIAQASTQSGNALYAGLIPNLGYLNAGEIPNYWEIKYMTGFKKVPMDIINVIGMLASINMFHIAGDLILGAGIASQSLGIDGLSQSISTTSSATNAGYGARIIGYQKDLKVKMPGLKDYYAGYIMGAM